MVTRRAHAFVVALCASGCFYSSTWQQDTASQRRQAEELAPTTPGAEDPPSERERWRVARELRVRAWASPQYRAEVHQWRSHVESLLERASRVTSRDLGIRLVLADARTWEQPEVGSLDRALDALAAQDPGDDVDLVLGLLGSLPVLSANLDTLGTARIHGKHSVLRAMNDAAESEAIEQAFDRLSDEERQRLRRRREAHKEVAVLLHEIGHLLGGIHVREHSAFMSPVYDTDMSAFGPATLALVRPAVADRRRPEDERNGESFVEALREALHEHREAFVADEHARLLAALEQSGATTTAGAEPAAQAHDDRAGTLWDVTSLPEANRAAYHTARDAFARRDLRAAWESLAPLVEPHADVYAVQELACELYNHRAAPRDVGAVACRRMMDLAVRTQ